MGDCLGQEDIFPAHRESVTSSTSAVSSHAGGPTLQRALPHNLVTSSHQPRDVRTSIGDLGYPRPWPWRAEAISPEVCLSSSVPGNHLPLSPHMGSGTQQKLTRACFSPPPFIFSDLLYWPMHPFSPAFQDLLAFPKSTLIKDWTESHCLVASRTAQLPAPNGM